MLIEGVLTTGQYKDNNGATHYTTDVIANKIEFMDSRQEQRQQEPEGDFADYDTSDDCPF